jgi:hypothetical protein
VRNQADTLLDLLFGYKNSDNNITDFRLLMWTLIGGASRDLKPVFKLEGLPPHQTTPLSH